MRRHLLAARERGVELIHDLIESAAVGETIALAEIGAEDFSQSLACFHRHVGRARSRFAEFWELSRFSQIQQMSPDFGARRFWIVVARDVRLVQALEVR